MPSSKEAPHAVAGQSIPLGVELTAPEPLTERPSSRRTLAFSLKVAFTVSDSLSVSLQLALAPQLTPAPLHPLNV